MDTAGSLRLAVGADRNRWTTVQVERRVLGIVHNITSATRLIDLLAAFDADQRIQVFFSSPGSSALDNGTSEYLRSKGMLEIPWTAAESHKFDLAIATSRGGDLHNINAPLIGAPHGAGYNKQLSREPGAGSREPGAGSREPGAFGLTSEWLMHEDQLVPSVVLLSHDEQRERLQRGCPEAVSRSMVVGDPCFDQLTASRPLRASYRKALGVLPHQKLVVVTSTWGPGALLDYAEGDVLRRVLAELPTDEFRVLAVVHPNAWYGHGSWQLCSWLAPFLDSGLVLPAPETESWKAALVAADFLVGDHGSVTFYGVSMGIPALLGAFSRPSVAPDSPMERLGLLLPRLSHSRGLVEQFLDAAAFQETDPVLDTVRTEISSKPGEAAGRLRHVFYERLGLPEPSYPATTRLVPLPVVPAPSRQVPILPSMFVSTALSLPQGSAPATAVVRRYPATLQRGGGDHLTEAHLVVDHADPDTRWAHTADVLLVPEDRRPPGDEAAAWGSVGARLSGMVAVEEEADGCCLLLAEQPRLWARWLHAPAWASFAVAASVAYDAVCSVREGAGRFGEPGGLRIEVALGSDRELGLLAVTMP